MKVLDEELDVIYSKHLAKLKQQCEDIKKVMKRRVRIIPYQKHSSYYEVS